MHRVITQLRYIPGCQPVYYWARDGVGWRACYRDRRWVNGTPRKLIRPFARLIVLRKDY